MRFSGKIVLESMRERLFAKLPQHASFHDRLHTQQLNKAT